MYFFYVDEAGTSAPEPITIVVAIVINADRSWRRTAEEVDRIINQYVPIEFRSGYIFHAKDIWGNRQYRSVWSKEQRIEFISAMASIPRRLGLAISLGKVRRDWEFKVPPQMAACDFHHISAFRGCIARANKHVRDWGSRSEIATIVAEDVVEKRRFLKQIVKARINFDERVLNSDYIIPTKHEIAAGYITQTNSGRIDRVIDTVHFTQKEEAPLLQVADACAFSFRRYFSGQEYGEVWVNSMLNTKLILSEWDGPLSYCLFSFNPDHRLKVAISFRFRDGHAYF